MSVNNAYSLKIGETAKVRPGVFRTSESIVYAGMLNDVTYSVVVTCTFGNNSLAYNLYLPKDKKEIPTPKGRVQVEYISTEEMRFTYTES